MNGTALPKDSPAASTVAAAPDVPQTFLCQINGHIMKHPVRSKHGHVFERETIFDWIDSHGAYACPKTQESLTKVPRERQGDAAWRVVKPPPPPPQPTRTCARHHDGGRAT